MTDAELRALLDGAVLVLGCTGRDLVDRRLNRITRELGVPFVIPSLWGGDQDQVLGDLQIVAWNLPNRQGGCFECLRPARETEPPPAEAQRGLGAEVQRVATLTTEAVLGLLLPDSPQHAPLMRQLSRGANYFLIPRWPPSLRAVITRPRRGCPACSTGSRRVAAMSGPTMDAATLRDWAIGLSIASAVLWHQMIPGLDAVATIAFIGVAGLWWQGRLPNYRQTAALVRRTLGL